MQVLAILLLTGKDTCTRYGPWTALSRITIEEGRCLCKSRSSQEVTKIIRMQIQRQTSEERSVMCWGGIGSAGGVQGFSMNLIVL